MSTRPDAGQRTSDRPPVPGDLVHARSRRHLVERVDLSTAPAAHTLVHLACVDDDAAGERTTVLWEREVDACVLEEAGWSTLGERGFDAPGLFGAYLNTVRWNTVTSTDPELVQAPFRAGIEVMAYQLEPLRKALQLPRVNLFIADDVGLGKTIEAGLITRELMIRQRVQRFVVAAPPSVVQQWKDELEERFGLTTVIYDREYVRQKRIERGHAVNPWTTHSRFIISHALLRDPAYTLPLQDWLKHFAPGALLILDEAHHAAPASGSRYAIDSRFTRTIRDLAGRFEHRIFLSATPHNGHANSFAALLELLDPQRFTRGVPVRNARELDAVMVRRLKEDLRRRQGGFPVRHVPAIRITGLPDDAPELTLAAQLDELRKARELRLTAATRSARSAGQLTIINLQKRLWSSLEAFARTLAVHKRTLERLIEQGVVVSAEHAPNLERLRGEAGNEEDEEDTEEQLDAMEEAAMERATSDSGLGEVAMLRQELMIVDGMLATANQHRFRADARVTSLIDWIHEHLCPGLARDGAEHDAAAWLPRRVIIFTEYADTKRYLEQQLRGAIAGTDQAESRIAVYHGGMNAESREEIKRAFNEDPARNPLRILIATDAAREGLNLQQHCADLFHFDLPWNPARLEQRNGRIDRKGQRAPDVRCHYFVLEQRAEDRVLDTLVRKTETIRTELGSLAPVLQRDVERLLSDGFARDSIDEMRKRIEDADLDAERKATVTEQLEAARAREQDLDRQLSKLWDLQEKAQEWLNFNVGRFRAALDRSLTSSNLPALDPMEQGGRTVWRVAIPALDPAWIDTADTLRAPRPRNEPLDEWRRKAPLRPVVFEDDGRLDGDAVHLHLEHRLAQRLLGRFRSQGLVHYDLARACIGQTKDSRPRVILLGRLALYGPRAGRLHDEIISVAARWTPTAARNAPLTPYAEGGSAERDTLTLLDKTLPESDATPVPVEVERRLNDTLRRDVDELRPHLEARAEAAAMTAVELLKARGVREAGELQQLIRERATRIRAAATLAPQLELELRSSDEVKQLRAEQKHWEKRLIELADEERAEPVRLRETYDVKMTRFEPIGIVYLWPVTA